MRARFVTRSAAVCGLLLAAAACDDSPVGNNTGEPPAQVESDAATMAPPASRRIDLSFQVNGSFRPGAPVVVTSTARGRHAAADVEYELVVLDEGPDAGAEVVERGRAAGRFRGAIPRGGQQQLTATITFPKAGYYRVLAFTRSTAPAGETNMAGDTTLLNEGHEVIHLLIDERGGRATREFDPTAISRERVPLYGSFGPFAENRPRVPSATAARRSTSAAAKVYEFGRFSYTNNIGWRNPVANAAVTINCLDNNLWPLRSYPTTTSADGSFLIDCPYAYYDGSISLTNTQVNVQGPGNEAAGVIYFDERDGPNPQLLALNSTAAQAFVTLNRYVPIGNQRFAATRPRINVYASDNNSAYKIRYHPTGDSITLNYTRVYGEDGTFVTMHEYGHAYMWVAIEKPYYYTCGTTEHPISNATTLSCAYVEGFADFYATWLAGDVLTNTTYTDHRFETQTDYVGKDGAIVEASVAGFFYDLVDGPNEPDGADNRPLENESWDTAIYPASFIANTMRACVLTDAYTWQLLDGVDQLIYCLQNSPAEYSAAGRGASWRRYNTVARNATAPAGFSATTVRTLWRRNLYGLP